MPASSAARPTLAMVARVFEPVEFNARQMRMTIVAMIAFSARGRGDVRIRVEKGDNEIRAEHRRGGAADDHTRDVDPRHDPGVLAAP
jgi:hypothetical protein